MGLCSKMVTQDLAIEEGDGAGLVKVLVAMYPHRWMLEVESPTIPRQGKRGWRGMRVAMD